MLLYGSLLDLRVGSRRNVALGRSGGDGFLGSDLRFPSIGGEVGSLGARTGASGKIGAERAQQGSWGGGDSPARVQLGLARDPVFTRVPQFSLKLLANAFPTEKAVI